MISLDFTKEHRGTAMRNKDFQVHHGPKMNRMRSIPDRIRQESDKNAKADT